MSVITTMQARIKVLERVVGGLGQTTIEGYNRHANGGRVAFGRGVQTTEGVYVPPRTVAVIYTAYDEYDKILDTPRKPAVGDASLWCMEAIHLTSPPAPCSGPAELRVCDYVWFGTPFRVYPPLGTEVEAFADDAVEFYDDAHPPKLSTVFHRVHREHEVWVIDKLPKGTTIRIVRLLSVGPQVGDTQVIAKHQVPKLIGNPEQFTLVPEGDPFFAYIVRGSTASSMVDYQLRYPNSNLFADFVEGFWLI